MKFNLVESEDSRTLVVLVDGELVPILESHENFDEILDLLRLGYDVSHLLNQESAVVARFEALSDRVSVANGVVFFDGDPQDDVLAEHILRALNENADFMPLVNFMEKIATNPSERSRAEFYNWLRAQDATINSAGNIVSYKSVYRDGDGYRSVSAGTAYVNGERQQGRIFQRIGDEVSMPRAEVDDNGQVACSRGLHAGAWSYASTFSGDVVLEVEINPRDVVSVPDDANNTKVRVSKYKVVRELDKPYEQAVVSRHTSLSGYDYDDYDEEFDDENEWYF